MAGTKSKFGSALDGYWGSDNRAHVNFMGADDHVHELYIAPGRNWVDNDGQRQQPNQLLRHRAAQRANTRDNPARRR